jgi:hypothetical protein
MRCVSNVNWVPIGSAALHQTSAGVEEECYLVCYECVPFLSNSHVELRALPGIMMDNGGSKVKITNDNWWKICGNGKIGRAHLPVVT